MKGEHITIHKTGQPDRVYRVCGESADILARLVIIDVEPVVVVKVEPVAPSERDERVLREYRPRDRSASLRALAKRYGVSHETIRKIVQRVQP